MFDINNFKTRLAPTPSGFLHIGNGASFVATWALTRAYNSKIVLRIDDLDAERMRPEYVEDIFKTLDWLGVDWDDGPFSVDDFFKNWSQHLRLSYYEKSLNELLETGDLYVCHCSRRDIKLNSKNGLYPNTCRPKRLNSDNESLKYEKNTAWRIEVADNKTVIFNSFEKIGPLSISSNFDEKNVFFEKQTSSRFQTSTTLSPINLSQTMGDFIVRQKNGLPSYQLASLIDDTLFGVNFIVRGADLLPSTAAQIFLAEKLNQTPFLQSTFWHHPLITDAQGVKLSKSQGTKSLSAFRDMGFSASVVVQKAAKWLDCEGFEGETAWELVDFIKNQAKY